MYLLQLLLYYSCSSFWKWVLAGHSDRCYADSVFTGSQNAVSGNSLECWSSLYPVRWISSSWKNTRVLSAGEMKYLVLKSLWGTAGAPRDVELCSQHGSALAPSISHLPLRASCFIFSWKVSGLVGKHSVDMTFLDRKWGAPVAIPSSRVEAGRMEGPECTRNNTAPLSCKGGHLSCSPGSALEPHCEFWQPLLPAFSCMEQGLAVFPPPPRPATKL